MVVADPSASAYSSAYPYSFLHLVVADPLAFPYSFLQLVVANPSAFPYSFLQLVIADPSAFPYSFLRLVAAKFEEALHRYPFDLKESSLNLLT